MKRTGNLILTAAELEAVITVAGDADEWATCLSCAGGRRKAAAMVRSYERGMEKLREELSRLEGKI